VKNLHFRRKRFFRPICVLREFGFIGGPSGYEEISAEKLDVGPLVLHPIETGDPLLEAVEDEVYWTRYFRQFCGKSIQGQKTS